MVEEDSVFKYGAHIARAFAPATVEEIVVALRQEITTAQAEGLDAEPLLAMQESMANACPLSLKVFRV